MACSMFDHRPDARLPEFVAQRVPDDLAIRSLEVICPP